MVASTNARCRGVSWIVVSGIVWATGVPLLKKMVDPERYTIPYIWWRMATLVAGYAMGVGACCAAWPHTRTEWRTALRLAAMPIAWRIAGVLAIATAMTSFIVSMNMTYAATVLLEFATMPFWAAGLDRCFRGERLEKATIAAMVVAALGVAILAIDGWVNADEGDELHNAKLRPILGGVIGMFGAMGFAVFAVCQKTIEGNLAAKTGVSMSLWGAVLMVLGSSIAMLAKGGSNSGPMATPAQNIYLSVAHGIALLTGFTCYTAGTRYLPAAEAVLLSMLEIVIGIIFAVVFIDEVPTPLGAVGCSVTGLAVGFHGVRACRKSLGDAAHDDGGRKSHDALDAAAVVDAAAAASDDSTSSSLQLTAV